MRPSAVQPLNFDDFLLPPHRIRSKADGFGKTLPARKQACTTILRQSGSIVSVIPSLPPLQKFDAILDITPSGDLLPGRGDSVSFADEGPRDGGG